MEYDFLTDCIKISLIHDRPTRIDSDMGLMSREYIWSTLKIGIAQSSLLYSATAVGRRFGVAKAANITAVKVLRDDGCVFGLWYHCNFPT